MNSIDQLDYVIIYDELGEPQKRPRNKLYEMVAAQQKKNQSQGNPKHEWPPLIEIKGEPLSQTIIRERRGDFD